MSVIDWILNLACVLLWLNWRSVRLNAIPAAPGISLLGTLRPADSRPTTRWSYLIGVLAILFFRGLFYHQIGSAMSWMPTLELGAVSVPFRSDRLARILSYSFLVFGVWLAGFYAWVLLLSACNRETPDTDPIQRMVRLHLGRLEWWPASLKLLFVPLAAMLIWAGLRPALVHLGLIPAANSNLQFWAQSVIIGAASLVLWKYLLLGVFVLSFADTYVFLGNSPVWHFASTTARNLLRPLRLWPLRLGRIDFSSITGILLVIAISEGLARALPIIYQRL